MTKPLVSVEVLDVMRLSLSLSMMAEGVVEVDEAVPTNSLSSLNAAVGVEDVAVELVRIARILSMIADGVFVPETEVVPSVLCLLRGALVVVSELEVS